MAPNGSWDAEASRATLLNNYMLLYIVSNSFLLLLVRLLLVAMHLFPVASVPSRDAERGLKNGFCLSAFERDIGASRRALHLPNDSVVQQGFLGFGI